MSRLPAPGKSTDLVARLKEAEGILCDLDNTLYPRERGVFDLIRKRISEFVARLTGLGPAEVHSLRQQYISSYGTTLGGLMAHHRIDPEGFMEFVHDIPVEDMLRPDPELGAFLDSIDLPKIIFTNASSSHARKVLELLGVEKAFSGICDLEMTGYLGKPHLAAFEKAAGVLSCPLSRAIFLDDVEANVLAGARFGALTVLVGGSGNGTGDFQVPRLPDLKHQLRGMPWFGRNGGDGESACPAWRDKA